MHKGPFILKKGVCLHAFFDGSGLVLYDEASDETVCIALSVSAFNDLLSKFRDVSVHESKHLISQLIAKNVIVPHHIED